MAFAGVLRKCPFRPSSRGAPRTQSRGLDGDSVAGALDFLGWQRRAAPPRQGAKEIEGQDSARGAEMVFDVKVVVAAVVSGGLFKVAMWERRGALYPGTGVSARGARRINTTENEPTLQLVSLVSVPISRQLAFRA